jgi:hypothetical protein
MVARGRALTAGLVAVLALAAVGCGDKAENNPRVPDTLQLGARIGQENLLISPEKFGAGIVFITISNQTDATAQLRFRGPTEFTSKQVAPQGTENLKVNLLSGDYEVRALGAEAASKPTFLRVGPARESAQDDLLLP